MKAIRIEGFGGPDVLRLADLPVPSAGPGQIVVRVEAAGVNFIDVYHRTGLYPNPLPLVPGMEGAGVVAAVGPGVSLFREGDRVAWANVLGSYAEHALLAADRAVAVPPGIARRHAAAALMLQGMTAHYLCTSTFPLKKGAHLPRARGGGGRGPPPRADGEAARRPRDRHRGHGGQGRARARGGRRRGHPVHPGGLPRRGEATHRRPRRRRRLRLGGEDDRREEPRLPRAAAA